MSFPSAGTRLKMKIYAAVKELSPVLLEVSHAIHAAPELKFEERQAAALLAGKLDGAGFRVDRGAAGLPTAFVAEYQGGSREPVVALLAEYDALPGLGHGCGHNVIAAASLGAGLALARLGDELPGSVRVVGTPAEEGGGGKITLAAAGVFDGVQAALMLHPGTRTWVRDKALARRQFRLRFLGRSAHAAGAPHQGINALDALILTFNGINALRQEVGDDVRIHGIITRGGTAPNIIPDDTEALFLVRAATADYHREVVERFLDCARGAAEATGARLQVEEVGPAYEPLRSNQVLEDIFRRNLINLGWEETRPGAGMGSTDMGNVSQMLPAIHPVMAITREPMSVHTPEFCRAAISPEADRCVLDGARVLAGTVVDLCCDRRLLAAAWQEFRAGSW